MQDGRSTAPPAGCLRRAAAFAIDVLFYSAILSTAGALAFAVTDGRVQTDGLLPLFEACGADIPVPAEIDPAPELGDSAAVCSAGALPFVVSRRFLVVSVTTHPGERRSSKTFETHTLSASSRPTKAADATWLGRLGLLAYFAVGPAARGRTVGMRLLDLRLRAVGRSAPGRRVPILRLLIRTSIALEGFALPALAFVRAFGIREPGLASMAIFVGIVGPIAWMITNATLIACGRDPVYDKLAGLRVSTIRR